jgi:hypothetical protein
MDGLRFREGAKLGSLKSEDPGSLRPNSRLKNAKNAGSGDPAYRISKEITDFVGSVPSPGGFFNRLLRACLKIERTPLNFQTGY